jgi:peptide/nickel transport system substrate-binding protein
VVKYPHDPRRAEQLMAEAGFTKGADGIFTSPSDGRFTADQWVFQSAQNEAQGTVMAAIWRAVGFDIREVVQPAAMTRDAQARATFPAISLTGGTLGEEALAALSSKGIPRPTNRWFGVNRGSWTNPEFDRLADAYETTLDRNERIRQIVEMARILSDDVPIIALNFNPNVTAFRSNLTGPGVVAPGVAVTWNVHAWEMR